jgi:hypothetical protein
LRDLDTQPMQQHRPDPSSARCHVAARFLRLRWRHLQPGADVHRQPPNPLHSFPRVLGFPHVLEVVARLSAQPDSPSSSTTCSPKLLQASVAPSALPSSRDSPGACRRSGG